MIQELCLLLNPYYLLYYLVDKHVYRLIQSKIFTLRPLIFLAVQCTVNTVYSSIADSRVRVPDSNHNCTIYCLYDLSGPQFPNQ